MEKRKRYTSAAWVITFADLMTLLFCFFVLLTTLSTQPKNCTGIQEYMEGNKDQFKNYQLRSSKLSCIVSLPQDFLFQSGQAAIKKAAYQALTPFFETIKRLPSHLDDLVIVEGHTDNVPINTPKFKNNWELSSARATNIAIFLINQIQFDKVSVNAYGDSRPRIPYIDERKQPLTGQKLADARRANRRVEIVLTTPPKDLEEINLLFDGLIE